jgi:hypothetical protein
MMVDTYPVAVVETPALVVVVHRILVVAVVELFHNLVVGVAGKVVH